MRIEGYPTFLLAARARSSVASLQEQLVQAQSEATTGRRFDIGLALGGGVGRALTLRLDLDGLTVETALLEQAGKRADATQAALAALDGLATQFLSVMTGARGATDGSTIAADQSRAALGSLATLMNASFAGQYLFGGLNLDAAPIAVGDDSAGALAVRDAFEAFFGFPPDDPAVRTLTRDAMEGFLNGAFDQLFEDPAWQSNWTRAAADNLKTHIGDAGIDASANANEAFVRELTKAFTMMTELGGAGLGTDVFQLLADRALGVAAGAQAGLTATRTRVGGAEARLAAQVDHAKARQAVVTLAIREMEAVDQYEAATRVTTLMTQLEASYAMTGRIGRLSLLNYL